MKKIRKKIILCAVCALILTAAAVLNWRIGILLPENEKFERFTQELFTQEISSNTINLHYTLAYPEEYGIEHYPISLGSLSPDAFQESYQKMREHQNTLNDFRYDKLSEENQLIWDLLNLDFSIRLSSKDHYMLTEVLSPNLGIQAQLPVLLAEYTFRSRQDVENYLTLLSSITSYFQEILQFQQLKSSQGLFMSDTTADRVIQQCQSFLSQTAQDNYLSILFQEKLTAMDSVFTQAEQNTYIEKHTAILSSQVMPAYENLIAGLTALKGTGQNNNGLFYLSGGIDYYEYLVKSETGDYSGTANIEKRLYHQLLSDYSAMQKLITQHPEVLELLNSDTSLQTQIHSDSIEIPSKMLQILQKAITQDFPSLDVPSYEVKYIHPSLEEFSSPAFYLTPPADTLTPNTIYINNSSTATKMDLFTTLAHEGFPGHLYQTVYFGQNNASSIRNILNYGGYTEGWATYVEAYSYQYLHKNPHLTQLLWLNRSINLCLYSIIDIGIHFHGWTADMVTDYLSSFGITDEAICQEIFQYIVENPANYLKYYVGYLNFLDLRKEAQKTWGKDYSLKKFHKKILEIGPTPFPVLRKYIFL